MKRIMLLVAVFAFLALSLPCDLPALSKTPKETRVTGILHFGIMRLSPAPDFEQGATGYWLRSDEPLYVHQGSKSEASTNVVVLNVPADLQEKTRELVGQHIEVAGLVTCTSCGWGPGHASCSMTVEKITKFQEGTK